MFVNIKPRAIPRKMFLGEKFGYSQLVGVGGPGAPHAFCLERIGESGALSVLHFNSNRKVPKPSGFILGS